MANKPTRRIISAEDVTSADTWVPPHVSVGGGVTVEDGYNPDIPMTASQLQKIHEQTHKDAFDRGYKEGFAKGLNDGQLQFEQASGEALNHIKTILKQVSRPLDDLDDSVEKSLVSLAMSIGKHIVRREIKTDPAQIIGIIKESMSLLPVSSPRTILYLHPEDAVLVRDKLVINDGDSHWEIIEDPALTRGGCRLVSETSQIDASIENRIAGVISQILGEEREQ